MSDAIVGIIALQSCNFCKGTGRAKGSRSDLETFACRVCKGTRVIQRSATRDELRAFLGLPALASGGVFASPGQSSRLDSKRTPKSPAPVIPIGGRAPGGGRRP